MTSLAEADLDLDLEMEIYDFLDEMRMTSERLNDL